MWNFGNYQKRQAFFQKSLIPSGFTLAKKLKIHPLYKALGSAYSQQILNKLQEAWNSFFGSIKSKNVTHRVGLPRYFKNRQTDQTIPSLVICRNDCYKIDEKNIYITCPKDLKQKYNLKGLLRIKYNGILKWVGIQGKMEIKYRPFLKTFYAYQSVQVTPRPAKLNPANISSGDIGIKRYLVNYIKSSQDLVVLYPSEHIFKDYIVLSQQIFHLQQIAKKDNNVGSTKRIRRLFLKRKRKLTNYMNNLIAHLFRILQTNHISKLVVGDLSHILDAPLPVYFKNKEKLNTMIHNFWSFGLLIRKLQNKCEELGIVFEQINERGTSSTCPVCGSTVQPNDRKFKCSNCGYTQDRDVVGCIMIMNKYAEANQLHLRVENHPVVSTVLIDR
jgi:putative transposase